MASRGAPLQRYVFCAAWDDAESTVELPDQNVDDDDDELLRVVLVGYVADLHVQSEPLQSAPTPLARMDEEEEVGAGPEEDLNENDGEVVGTLDSSAGVNENLSLAERGHEKDPVFVELPEGADTLEELSGVEVLRVVRTIPPEERDWMLKGAVFVGHVLYLSHTHTNISSLAIPSLARPPCTRMYSTTRVACRYPHFHSY